MFCSSCGKNIPDESQFCPDCGKSIQGKIEIIRDVPVEKSVTTYVVFGFIFSGIALLFIPILFGALGIVMGYKTKKNGRDALGIAIMVVAIICMVIGTILGAMVALEQFY